MRLFRAALCAPLGAMTAVAVAWVFAVVVDPTSRSGSDGTGPPVDLGQGYLPVSGFVYRCTEPGVERIRAFSPMRFMRCGLAGGTDCIDGTPGPPFPKPPPWDAVTPRWAWEELAPVLRYVPYRQNELAVRTIDAAGWPMRALWRVESAEHLMDGHSIRTAKGGLVLVSIRPKVLGSGGPVMVPIRPLRVGMAVDAAIFSGLWAVVLFGPSVVRRASRRIRGRCAACGYDLGGLASGSTCPECGRV